MNAKHQLILALGLALAALAPAGARADTDVVPNPEAQAQAPAFTIGQPAPQQDVRMKGVSGTDISIAEAAGAKGTLVIFTCNHCPWVKMWQTRSEEHTSELQSRRDLVCRL